MDPLKSSLISGAIQKIDTVRAKDERAAAPADLPCDCVMLAGKRDTKPEIMIENTGTTAQDPPDDPPKKKWSVLIYSSGDNNLVNFHVEDVKEMERVGSDEHTNLVVQLDRGGSIGCKRYLLEKHTGNQQPDGITSPVLENLGDWNMASSKSLSDFIKWGVKSFPAEHYCLILSDHGDAWHGACEDDSAGAWMDMAMIKEGISAAQADTGAKMDIIGFDACLMANTEVGYQLRDVGNFLVASEETEGAEGWPYQKVLTEETLREFQRMLNEKIELPPDELAKKVVLKSADNQGDLPTMSAADLTQMGDLACAADSFAQALLDTSTPASTLKSIAGSTQSFEGVKDLYDFAERVSTSGDISDEAVKKAAQGVIDSLQRAIIAEQHSEEYPGAHGLSIELPTWSPPGEDYGQLDFAKDTKWDEAMKKITS